MSLSRLLFVNVILLACAFLIGDYIGSNSKKQATEKATVPSSIQPESAYDTTTTSKSLFTDDQAYFSADPSPGKVAVKPMSAFNKMISETCVKMNYQTTSVSPLGPGVIINGEVCYGAVHITFAPLPISAKLKKSF